MDDRMTFITTMERQVKDSITSKFPVVTDSHAISIDNIEFERPVLNSIQNELEIKRAQGTLSGKVFGQLMIKDKDNNIVSQRRVKIMDLPYPSLRGTFIIKGNEKVVLAQNVSRGGAFVANGGLDKASFDVRLENYSGPRISAEVDENVLRVSVGGKNFNGIAFLEYIGLSPGEIDEAIGNDDLGRRLKDNRRGGGQGTLDDLYDLTAKRGGYVATTREGKIQAIQEYFAKGIALSADEKDTLQTTLKVKGIETFNREAFKAAISKTVNVARDADIEDDRDDLLFQYVKSPIDLIGETVDNGMKDFVASAKASIKKRNPEVKNITPALARVNPKVENFFKLDSRVSTSDETNPLLLHVDETTMISTGTGGLNVNALRHDKDPRNLKRTGINRLDSVHTPESGKIGLSLRLSQDAKIDKGTITTKVIKVSNGKAEDLENNIVDLTPKQEHNSYVAFNSPRDVEKIGISYVFKNKMVPGRYQGIIQDIPVEKVQYLDRRPQNLFGLATNLVPFAAHNDGNRMLMAANMQTQAMNIMNREEPLVQVDSGDGKTYERIMGDKAFTVKAPTDGRVIEVAGSKIVLESKDGKKNEVEIYDYFPLNKNNFLNNEPVVKVGDEVKEGQMIAEGWQTRNGSLALGLNARVGYMPYKGYNFEDGIVISEDFAERMRTEEIISEDVVVGGSHIGGTGSGAKRLMRQYISTSKSLENLDDDGVIKEGAYVNPGDILVARLKPSADKDVTVEQAIFRKIMGSGAGRESYTDKSAFIPPHSYTKGKVIRVVRAPGGDGPEDKETITIEILTEKTLKQGDKLSGRHGNKGTITKILARDEMPTTEDGKALDLIFSPLAVPSRKNVGQLLEVNSGLIAEKTGAPQIIQNFDPDAKEKVLKKLEEIGIPDGKVSVINPDTGKPYENNVTVGNMYIMKLKHKVDDKIQARDALQGSPNLLYMSPVKQVGNPAGEKHNPQKLGEMEIRALQAHGAVQNLLEATTLKGDGAGDAKSRMNIFRVLSGRQDPSILEDSSGTPESLKIFRDYVASMGMAVRPFRGSKELKSLDDNFDGLMVTPQRDKDIVKFIGANNKVLSARQYYVKTNNTERPEKNGLYDADIFGDSSSFDPEELAKQRTKWGYIELNTAVPNPVLASNVSSNPYKLIANINAGDFKKLVQNGTHVLVTNPGDSGLGKGALITPQEADELELSGKNFEYKVGGDAIEAMLSEVDVDKELKATDAALKVAKGSQRDHLYKRYRALKSLQDNDLKPTDLVTRIVPVAPLYVRPRISDNERVQTDELNTLYANVIKSNLKNEYVFGKDGAEFATASDKLNAFNSVYQNYEKLIGTKREEERNTMGDIGFLDGLKQKLFGDDSSKEGLVRDRMLAKRVDYSGRAVIGVDPTLKMNQAAIPAEMAKYLYRPFVIKELINRGVAKDTEEAERMANNVHDPKVMRAIEKAVQDRPVILNRAPSLHKFSVLAFDPVIKNYDDQGNPIRSIQINPMVVSGFNADFDGDQMAAHVPLTEKARKEANRLMKPSDNMINPRNGEIVIEIKHEMIQGLYYLTMNSDKPNEVAPKSFGSAKEVRAAYKKGDIRTHDPVTVDGRTTTAGMVIFNSALPKKHQRWNVVISDKEIKPILKEMYDDKSLSKIELSNIIDGLKEIGFEAATMSGMSIGVRDFIKPKDADFKIDEAIRMVDESLPSNPGSLIAKYRDVEMAIENSYKKENVLGEHNPVQIMMASGARGNAGQIRRMAVTVGVGKDINDNLTAPVKSSHLDGLMPQEYYVHSYDARKGLSDRTLSTSKPGEITREIWAAVQDTSISEKDCKTKNGIVKPVNNTILGRFASDGVPNIIGAGDLIDKVVIERLKQAGIKEIEVRSPITCESLKGVCSKCYGTNPGTLDMPTVGDPVGIVASQSFGEPITQMTMNTFHTGGTGSAATMGLPRVSEILNAKDNPSNKAVLATSDGVVSINDDPTHAYIEVLVGGKIHKVSRRLRLKVNDGDYVSKGDFLTVGGISDFMNPDLVADRSFIFTSAAPGDVLSLNRDKGETKALSISKQYVANALDYSVAKTLNQPMGTAVDSRHLEIIADKLGDKVKVIDGGDSPFKPGQYVSRKEADAWNKKSSDTWFDGDSVNASDSDRIIGARAAKDIKGRGGEIIVRKGETIDQGLYGQILMTGTGRISIFPKPIVYEGEIVGVTKSYHLGNENWFSDLGSQNAFKTLGSAAVFGYRDELSDSRGRQMAGLLQPIGEGFEAVKEFGGSLGKSLLGMFTK